MSEIASDIIHTAGAGRYNLGSPLMRSFRTRLAAATSLVIGASCFAITTARADGTDFGDNIVSCNRGELCYSQDNPATSWQRDFWWSGDDGPYYFRYTANYSIGGRVLNHASSMNNRLSCYARVIDWNADATAVSAYQDFSQHPDSSKWVAFNSRMNDHNDAHLRCGHY